MYVRTKKGEIFDCYESEQMHKPIYYPKKSKTNGYIDCEDVYEKSDNLIDILQVGDYVNSLKVDEIDEKGIYNYNSYDGWRVNITNCDEDIKSIVTHEQFESIEYRTGE